MDAKVIGTDPKRILALLKVGEKGELSVRLFRQGCAKGGRLGRPRSAIPSASAAL